MKALITGVTGQDGSYLAELLLSKNYEVHGIIRRSSSFNTQRIDHIFDELQLHFGDMTDSGSLFSLIHKIQPDEIYNLASMSHVKVSFEIPEYTENVTALGTTRLLEAVRQVKPDTKFYNAASSEQFGNSPPPQNEDTPMLPGSPYAIAKLHSYFETIHYRNSYGIFAVNGILFNHESILKNSPLIVKKDNGLIDIIPIEDMFRTEKHKYEGLKDEYANSHVWNGKEWTRVLSGSCYKDAKKRVRLIQSRKACYEATFEHAVFKDDGAEVMTVNLGIGNKLFKIEYPENNQSLFNDDISLLRFIGYIVGDGHIALDGGIRLIGIDKEELLTIALPVIKRYGWSYRLTNKGVGEYDGCRNDIWDLDINNDSAFGHWLRSHIYTERSSEKRIPIFVLNSDNIAKKVFYEGYYMADGRQKGNETYKYKGFTTKSATLCLGLVYLMFAISPNQEAKVKCDYRAGRRYYYAQFTTDKPTNKGRHLTRDKDEIVDIVDTAAEDNWFYDIQTESQSFATGANLIKVHNSPRRGETFVTRKITKSIANILSGKQDKLLLGNLEARRDWGYAKEYMEAIWEIMQLPYPEDIVIGTGETHTVKEFVEEAFGIAGLSWQKYVEIDERYYRPTEVDVLQADIGKAEKLIGWKPKVKFKELVKMMVDADMRAANLKPR